MVLINKNYTIIGIMAFVVLLSFPQLLGSFATLGAIDGTTWINQPKTTYQLDEPINLFITTGTTTEKYTGGGDFRSSGQVSLSQYNALVQLRNGEKRTQVLIDGVETTHAFGTSCPSATDPNNYASNANICIWKKAYSNLGLLGSTAPFESYITLNEPYLALTIPNTLQAGEHKLEFYWEGANYFSGDNYAYTPSPSPSGRLCYGRIADLNTEWVCTLRGATLYKYETTITIEGEEEQIIEINIPTTTTTQPQQQNPLEQYGLLIIALVAIGAFIVFSRK